MITAVIFDMDGLMVDTEPLSRRAWDAVLRPLGATLDDETQGRIIGLRIDATAALLREEFGLSISAESLIAQKKAAMAALVDEGIPTMPGLTELHALLAEKSIPWGVATSSPRAHAESVLKQLGQLEVCRAIAAGDEVINGKPAPDIYLLAAKRMGVDPQHCLALEDSAPGCRAAAAAGMTVAAVPNSMTDGASFDCADYRFGSLHEALTLFTETNHG